MAEAGGAALVTRGTTRPRSLAVPQQATVPLVRIPQLWKVPALTLVKVPDGGEASPSLLRPQQATVWSVRMAQTWPKPTLTWVKVPLGTVVTWPKAFLPQQTIVLLTVRMPQIVKLPELMALKVVAAGMFVC